MNQLVLNDLALVVSDDDVVLVADDGSDLVLLNMEVNNFIIDPVEAMQELRMSSEEGVLVVKETEGLQLVVDLEVVPEVAV